MSSYSRIVTLDGRLAASVKAWLRMIPGFRPEAIARVASYFADIAGGVHSGRLTVATTAVQATGTITLSSFVDEDTITINGIVFSGETVPSGNAEFAIGASDTATAANAVAVINAYPSSGLTTQIVASSASNVITITSLVPGYIGNMNTIAISAHGTVSGVNLTGGSEDANVVMYNGI